MHPQQCHGPVLPQVGQGSIQMAFQVWFVGRLPFCVFHFEAVRAARFFVAFYSLYTTSATDSAMLAPGPPLTLPSHHLGVRPKKISCLILIYPNLSVHTEVFLGYDRILE